MNKKAKIAMAAVSVVMAGTMALGIVGCTPTPTPGPTPGPEGPGHTGGTTIWSGTDANAAKIVKSVEDNLNYNDYLGLCNTAYTRLVNKNWVAEGSTQAKLQAAPLTDGVSLELAVGDDAKRTIKHGTAHVTGTNVVLPNGENANAGNLKPVWNDIQNTLTTKLGKTITFTEPAFNKGGELGKIRYYDENGGLAGHDIITDSATNVALTQTKLLDLNLYLDEMPNYKAFLNANPTVKDSLTFNGGSMYYAPYFDGYNDVEKYSLFKNNWVRALLDDATEGSTQTWAASMTAKGKTDATAAGKIQAFMGTTGSWNTEVLDKDGKKVDGGITVNYDKALAAAQDSSKGLGLAIATAAETAYDGESGNIVDFMNFVIQKKAGAVTGAQLRKIMQEYIKVAYYVGGTEVAFYTQTGYKLSDVFAGNSAAWDVDLFAALGRVMLTNPTLLKSGKDGSTIGGTNATSLENLYLISPRYSGMQRSSDVVSWMGELYGLRGLESRYGYAYIDAEGLFNDVRGEENVYRAAKAFNAFYEEGLIHSSSVKPANDDKDAKVTYYYTNSIETMCEHDYLNTQTPTGFQLEGKTEKFNIEQGFDYTANLTAISKWDTDADGKIQDDEYFRFTESWRSVKDQGFSVPLASVSNSDGTQTQAQKEKLTAILAFIDYIFSDDGQIMMSYGKPASDANGTGGFWYNPEVPAGTSIAADGSVTVGGKTYKGTFKFNGKTYASDTWYGKRYNPTLTEKTLKAYVGEDVNGFTYDGDANGSIDDASRQWVANVLMNYTEFARLVMGSALNFGNKLTSLEYQLTSAMGRRGAEKVDNAISNGVIRHVTPSLETYEFKSSWYKIVPTSLPFTQAETATDGTLNKNCSDLYQKGTKDTVFSVEKNSTTNLFYEIIMHGYDYSQYPSGQFGKLNLASAN